MSFLLEIAVGYIVIVYGLIPLCILVWSFFLLIMGLIVRAYYAIEDFLTGEQNEDTK